MRRPTSARDGDRGSSPRNQRATAAGRRRERDGRARQVDRPRYLSVDEAPDAVAIDTTTLSFEETVQRVLDVISKAT